MASSSSPATADFAGTSLLNISLQTGQSKPSATGLTLRVQAHPGGCKASEQRLISFKAYDANGTLDDTYYHECLSKGNPHDGGWVTRRMNINERVAGAFRDRPGHHMVSGIRIEIGDYGKTASASVQQNCLRSAAIFVPIKHLASDPDSELVLTIQYPLGQYPFGANIKAIVGNTLYHLTNGRFPGSAGGYVNYGADTIHVCFEDFTPRQTAFIQEPLHSDDDDSDPEDSAATVI